MNKKMSIIMIVVLFGLSQNIESKMFEKTRAKAQEKYGAWKAGRQQRKEAKPGPLQAAGAKRESRGGMLSRFRQQKPVDLPQTEIKERPKEPGFFSRAATAVKEYPQRRRERKEGKEVGKQMREKQQREFEQKKREQEAARQQPIRTQIEKKQREAHTAFERESTAIATLRTQLAVEREKPHYPEKFQKIKQHEEAIAERTRQRDLAHHTAQREREALQHQLSP